MEELRKAYVFDAETDGLLDELTKLHVFSSVYKSPSGEWKVRSTDDEKEVEYMFEDPKLTFVGHNIYLFDIPAFQILCPTLKPKSRFIDTLFLSWYLRSTRIKEGKKHGLASYGEDYGVPKPKVEDWKGQPYEVYKNRCEEDVKINTNVWHEFLNELDLLYNGDEARIQAIINFLMCKAQVYQMHLYNPLRLDTESTQKHLTYLENIQEEKEAILKTIMPQIPVIYKKRKPKVMYKKDGSTSKAGEDWFKLLDMYNLPPDHDDVVEHIRSYKDPNPGSVAQIKDWLFGLGWKPEIFEDSFSKVTGKTKKVPQTKDKDKNLCSSILKLAEKQPKILEFEDIGIISHRKGYLKGFLRDCDSDGNIVAGIAGLTNTLRIRHRGLVNLPAPSSNYGEYIRSVLLPPEGHVMIGSDLSGLENTTRNNFVYKLDPDFVELQNHKYYDPHLEIGVIAGMITEDDSNFYKWWKAEKKAKEKGGFVEYGDIQKGWLPRGMPTTFDDRHHKLDKIRHQAKTTNYSAMYGVGAPKLSKELKISTKEARKLLDAYWKKNWSIREFAKRCKTKTVNGQMWVLNPLNKFWYSLRSEKDIFSTVNQSAGDYIFTLWEKFLMEDGIIIRAGFHDEVVVTCPPEKQQETIDKLYSAIDKVNEVLGLEIPVGIDHKIGNNYSEVH